MIRIAFIIFVVLHGLIHLMGFVKAFNFAEISELNLPISKFMGIVWLSACLMFLGAMIQFYLEQDYWWLTSIIAIVLSQGLIFFSWQDAKFGTIANVIILIITVLTLSGIIANETSFAGADSAN